MKFAGLRILKDELAGEVINFCITNNLFSEVELSGVSVDSLARQLEHKEFIDTLIQALIERSCDIKIVEVDVLKKLLVELVETKIDIEKNM